jgi:hypothetical protein
MNPLPSQLGHWAADSRALYDAKARGNNAFLDGMPRVVGARARFDTPIRAPIDSGGSGAEASVRRYRRWLDEEHDAAHSALGAAQCGRRREICAHLEVADGR